MGNWRITSGAKARTVCPGYRRCCGRSEGGRGATIGDCGSGIEHLKRGGKNKALADGHVVCVAGDPRFGIIDALPLAGGDKAGGLARQVDAGGTAQAKELGIVGEFLFAQTLERGAIAAGHLVEKDVTRLRQSGYYAHGAVTGPIFMGPAVERLGKAGIFRVEAVGQPMVPPQ